MNLRKVRSILDTIGNTPLIETEIEGYRLYLKLEMFNPGGSIKDRVALYIIEDAERKGLINENTRFIEATSGNTGIGIALVCAAKGYKCTIVMPENMSNERKMILKAFGAELILTPASMGIKGAVQEVERLTREKPNVYLPLKQFENPLNPEAHYKTTSIEILRQIGSIPDAFVAGVGTGGTLMGIARRFKEVNPKCKVFAVEPKASPVLSEGVAGKHSIQGIGAGFVPKIMDMSLVDDVITISYDEAKEFSNVLASKYGIFAGVSSGANVAALLKVARKLGRDEKLVTVLPDTGERYLSIGLFG